MSFFILATKILDGYISSFFLKQRHNGNVLFYAFDEWWGD